MKKSLLIIALLLAMGSLATAQDVSRPAWKVSLAQDASARSTLTVQNRCSRNHNFRIDRQNVPFLNLSQTEVSVGGGQNFVVPVTFNTAGLEPRLHQGNVLVVCLTCKSEPTCTQDREVLPVMLTVIAPVPTQALKEQDPCKGLEDQCEDLRVLANQKESEAAGAQDVADETKIPAGKAAKDAETAKQRADEIAESAKDDPSDYKARVNAQEYSSADVAYRRVLQERLNNQRSSGAISNSEYQERTKANTTKKARQERLRNKANLKIEAAKAKAAADRAKAKADAAKSVADAAQKVADEARTIAQKARSAYDACVARMKEECRKIKMAAAKAAADKKKLEEEAAKSAAAAAKLKRQEETRIANKKAREKELREKDEYLLDNMKKLGLIDSRSMTKTEIDSIYKFMPWWLQTPASMLAELKTSTPIPVDTINAIAGLYGIAGRLLDPCTGKGMHKTIDRLRTMTNPKTGKNYDFDQAFTKTNDMCGLMRRIKTKLEEIRRIQQTR